MDIDLVFLRAILRWEWSHRDRLLGRSWHGSLLWLWGFLDWFWGLLDWVWLWSLHFLWSRSILLGDNWRWLSLINRFRLFGSLISLDISRLIGLGLRGRILFSGLIYLRGLFSCLICLSRLVRLDGLVGGLVGLSCLIGLGSLVNLG